MDSAGVITGTPTTLGAFTPTVTVLDSVGATASRSDYTVNINSSPSITTTSLPDGEQNLAYSTTVAGTNGTTPYTWSAVTALPAGLTLSSAGVISGTPSVAGNFTFTLALTDKAGVSAPNQSVSIKLYPRLTLSTKSNCDVKKGSQITTFSLTSSGGKPPITWGATGLPAGLTIDTSTGAISGTTSANGSSAVTVSVTDAFGVIVSVSFTISPKNNPNPEC
jgi:hypothetical protein